MGKKVGKAVVKYKPLYADGDSAFKMERSLDTITFPGSYLVEITHNGADVGLPIEDCGDVHYIVGTLVVTDSGTGGRKQVNRVIGQVITVTLRKNKETSIYTRTYAGGKWGAWYSLARTGMYDEITNADALYSTVTSLVSATKKTEESLHSTIINYNEWKGNNYELSLSNVLADDEFVKMVKSGTILIFKNTSTIWKHFQYAAASTAVTDVKNYSNWKELSGATYGIKQAVDAHKVQISTTGENGGVKDIINIAAATAENAGVMSAEDKKLLQYGCGSDLAGEFILKGWITPTGYFTENADYRATDFVALNRNNALVAIGGYNSSAALITFYDSDKKYISGYNNVSEKIIPPAEFPEDAVYFRCSISIKALDTIKVYNASIASVTKKLNNLETNFEDTEKDVAELTSRTDSIVSELYPVTVITFPNRGYITKEGLVYGTNGYSRHSDKIPIKNILEIYSSAVIGVNVYAIIFYDKDGGIISGVEGDETKAVGTLSFTEEQLKADSFRVQFYANSEAMAEKRSVCYVTRYMHLPTSVRVNNLEELIKGNGLKVLIFGDSITTNADFSINENHQTTAYTFRENSNGYEDENGNWVSFSMWPYLMTRYISCSDVRNYAQSGASYKESQRESGYERQNLSYQVQLALNDVANPNGAFPTVGNFVPDVIIFALGTNDGNPNDTYESAMEKTVMSADDNSFDVEATLANLDVTKTCEAMRYAFLKVKQAFPQSLCLCVLPIQRANTETPGINDALEKMAKRYSIKIVDGYSELGVVRDLEIWNGFGANLKDGLHPNDKGQKLYTRMMVNAIKNNWVAL